MAKSSTEQQARPRPGGSPKEEIPESDEEWERHFSEGEQDEETTHDAGDGGAFDDAEKDEDDWVELPLRKLPASRHAEHLELVDGRRLHPTVRFWLLLGITGLTGIGALLLALGARLYTWAAVVGGVAAVLALILMIAGLGARGGARNSYVDVQRTVEAPDDLVVGGTFNVTLDASGSRFGGGVKARIRETPTPGLTPVQAARLHRPGVVTFKVCANQRGTQLLRGVDVLLTDGMGLWLEERRYRLETPVEVRPGKEALGLRAQVGGQMAFIKGTPKALIHIFRDVEHEKSHPYGPGDRMKDVDWKRASITGEMIVRERITESSTHVLMLFDCGTSMNMIHPGGWRSIDIALEYAHEITANATTRTIPVGYLAFDDKHAIDFMLPSKKKSLDRDLPEKFHYFTDPLGQKEERDPMRRLLHEQTLEASMNHALKRGLGPKTSIVLFTDLDSINESVLQIVGKLAQGGVKGAVVMLPAPTYRMKRRYRLAGGKAPNGFRGVKVRKEMREVLMAQDVEFLDLRHLGGDRAR